MCRRLGGSWLWVKPVAKGSWCRGLWRRRLWRRTGSFMRPIRGIRLRGLKAIENYQINVRSIKKTRSRLFRDLDSWIHYLQIPLLAASWMACPSTPSHKSQQIRSHTRESCNITSDHRQKRWISETTNTSNLLKTNTISLIVPWN